MLLRIVIETNLEWLTRLTLLALLPVDTLYCVGQPCCLLTFMQLSCMPASCIAVDRNAQPGST